LTTGEAFAHVQEGHGAKASIMNRVRP
jgi:hypothetical protein